MLRGPVTRPRQRQPARARVNGASPQRQEKVPTGEVAVAPRSVAVLRGRASELDELIGEDTPAGSDRGGTSPARSHPPRGRHPHDLDVDSSRTHVVESGARIKKSREQPPVQTMRRALKRRTDRSCDRRRSTRPASDRPRWSARSRPGTPRNARCRPTAWRTPDKAFSRTSCSRRRRDAAHGRTALDHRGGLGRHGSSGESVAGEPLLC